MLSRRKARTSHEWRGWMLAFRLGGAEIVAAEVHETVNGNWLFM
jgi:hypothetical protein